MTCSLKKYTSETTRLQSRKQKLLWTFWAGRSLIQGGSGHTAIEKSREQSSGRALSGNPETLDDGEATSNWLGFCSTNIVAPQEDLQYSWKSLTYLSCPWHRSGFFLGRCPKLSHRQNLTALTYKRIIPFFCLPNPPWANLARTLLAWEPGKCNFHILPLYSSEKTP